MSYSKQLNEAALEAEVPPCLRWSAEEVGQWIERIGFPQYKECFVNNFVTGRKLIHIDASHLPLIGVTDFQHIKELTKSVRQMLKQDEPDCTRSLSVPETNRMGLYLERQAQTGARANALTYNYFLKENHKSFSQWFGREN